MAIAQVLKATQGVDNTVKAVSKSAGVYFFLLYILAQLSAQSSPCFDILFRLYSKHGSGAQKPGDGVLTQLPERNASTH
jgi:hypothetical protein